MRHSQLSPRLLITMFFRNFAFVPLLLILASGSALPAQGPGLKYVAEGNSPELLATYEAWFGHSSHMAVTYSSDDERVLRDQIDRAKKMGISAFVVDWYGDREPYIDRNYALLQKVAGKRHFHVAMMYDLSGVHPGDTNQVIADLTEFQKLYLDKHSSGHDAYLTFANRPVIFVFPAGIDVDWDRVRSVVNQWDPAPLLIGENFGGKYTNDFDGYYPWISPGPKGWSADGSNWGEDYLAGFYQQAMKHAADKIIVGGAWASFDDSKASWGENRHIAARCGQTLRDTMNLWKRYVPAGQVIPFLMIETWNDYEEGSAIEGGIPACAGQPAPKSLQAEEQPGPPSAGAR